MPSIKINTEQVREVGLRLNAGGDQVADAGNELRRAINDLDTWAWDGRSRQRAEPKLAQVAPQSARLAEELHHLGQMLRRVADVFEREDHTAAGELAGMPWVSFEDLVKDVFGGLFASGVLAAISKFWDSFHGELSERDLLWRKVSEGSITEGDAVDLLEFYGVANAAEQYETLVDGCNGDSACELQGLKFITSVQPGTIGTSYAAPPLKTLENIFIDGDVGAGMEVIGNVISLGTHAGIIPNPSGASHTLIGVEPGVFVESGPYDTLRVGPNKTNAADAYIQGRNRDRKLVLQEVPGITDKQRKDAAEFAKAQQGKSYDVGGLVGKQNPDKWYCSELAYESMKQAGVTLDLGEDSTPSNFFFNGLGSLTGMNESWGEDIDRNRVAPRELEKATYKGRSLYTTYPR